MVDPSKKIDDYPEKGMESKDKFLYFIFFILVVSCILILGLVFMKFTFFTLMQTGLIEEDVRKIPDSVFLFVMFVSILIPLAVYIKIAYRAVPTNKIGAKVFQGIPRKPVKYGPHIVLWPFERIVILPGIIIKLNFIGVNIIVNSGFQKELEVAGVKKEELEKFEMLTVFVDTGMNVVFDVKRILNTLRYLPQDIWDSEAAIPGDNRTLEERVRDHFAETNAHIVREIGARYTWVQLKDNKDIPTRDMKVAMAATVIFGSSGFSIEQLDYLITEVKLSDDVREAIEAIETARRAYTKTIIDADAAKEKKKREIETVELEGMAKARIKAAEIKESVKGELQAAKEAFELSTEQAINYTVAAKLFVALPGMNFNNYSLGENLGENLGKVVENVLRYVREGMAEIKTDDQKKISKK